MRSTKQKRQIREIIASFRTFFSVEELFKALQQQKSKIGLATVYRLLKNLEENGEIHSYLCNNRKIYSTKKDCHIHFTCEKCSQIKHIKAKNVDFLQEVINDQICHFQIDVTGICKNCR